MAEATREEMLALANEIETESDGLAMMKPIGAIQLGIRKTAAVIAALRSAATPNDVQAETIEAVKQLSDRVTPDQRRELIRVYGAYLDNEKSKQRTALSPSGVGGGTARVSIKRMNLSDGRVDHFVSISVGDREVTPHVFREEYKAAYHVALYDWLLNGSSKPDLVKFGPDDWPALSHEVGSMRYE